MTPLRFQNKLNSSGELEDPDCMDQELEKQIDENIWQENLEAARLSNSTNQHSETEHDIKCEKREEDTVNDVGISSCVVIGKRENSSRMSCF